jgi:hypothetical protein
MRSDQFELPNRTVRFGLTEGALSIRGMPIAHVPPFLKENLDHKLELKLTLFVKSIEQTRDGEFFNFEFVTDGEPQWKKAE